MKGLKLWEVLKALDEGKEVQFELEGEWITINGNMKPDVYDYNIKNGTAYRIKPEVEAVESFLHFNSYLLIDGISANGLDFHTHKITIEFEDGEPICSSIKMEKI
jgi:hypothetical protein